MTAGTTTQRLEGRVSLPRAGLGALLAATLVMGGLIGAAISAEIGATITPPATLGVSVPHESAVVRNLRIAAGRGQMIGETSPALVGLTLARESAVVRDLRIAAGRGQLIGETTPAPVTGPTATTVVLTHAPGHGPVR